MDTRPLDNDVVADVVAAGGLSRRTALLKVSAGGVAAALLVRGVAQPPPRMPSPTPAYAAGVTAEILGRIEPQALPGTAATGARHLRSGC